MMRRGTRVNYIDLVNEVTSPLPPIPIARMPLPPWQPLAAPLHESTVMLVSSAGVHLRAEPPFAPVDDLTFRRIPADTDPKLLRPSHPSPIRRPGLMDLNVVHPAQRLAELADQGLIGGVTDHHLAMLGAVKSLVPLVSEMGPAMAADARTAGAGVVMLVPLCPACHQAIALLARVIEREGIPTVTVTGACDITERVRPPRAGFLNFPLGYHWDGPASTSSSARSASTCCASRRQRPSPARSPSSPTRGLIPNGVTRSCSSTVMRRRP